MGDERTMTKPRWHWYTCPQCFNSKAGKEPGEGRITAARVHVYTATYIPPLPHPFLGLRDRITHETWRLTCPCGHVWERERET
jgi:hypothetical protein